MAALSPPLPPQPVPVPFCKRKIDAVFKRQRADGDSDAEDLFRDIAAGGSGSGTYVFVRALAAVPHRRTYVFECRENQGQQQRQRKVIFKIFQDPPRLSSSDAKEVNNRVLRELYTNCLLGGREGQQSRGHSPLQQRGPRRRHFPVFIATGRIVWNNDGAGASASEHPDEEESSSRNVLRETLPAGRGSGVYIATEYVPRSKDLSKIDPRTLSADNIDRIICHMRAALRDFRSLLLSTETVVADKAAATTSTVPLHLDLHPGNWLVQFDSEDEGGTVTNVVLIDFDLAEHASVRDYEPDLELGLSDFRRHFGKWIFSNRLVNWITGTLGKKALAGITKDRLGATLKTMDDVTMFAIYDALLRAKEASHPRAQGGQQRNQQQQKKTQDFGAAALELVLDRGGNCSSSSLGGVTGYSEKEEEKATQVSREHADSFSPVPFPGGSSGRNSSRRGAIPEKEQGRGGEGGPAATTVAMSLEDLVDGDAVSDAIYEMSPVSEFSKLPVHFCKKGNPPSNATCFDMDVLVPASVRSRRKGGQRQRHGQGQGEIVRAVNTRGAVVDMLEDAICNAVGGSRAAVVSLRLMGGHESDGPWSQLPLGVEYTLHLGDSSSSPSSAGPLSHQRATTTMQRQRQRQQTAHSPRRCTAPTKSGPQCKNKALAGTSRCRVHTHK